MNVLDIAKKRYSVRTYEDKPVEKEKLEKILASAHVAPTAANLQPVKLLVVQDKERLKSIAKAGNIYNAPLAIIVCADHSKAWTRPFDNKQNADELKSIQVGGIDFITKPYDTLILLEKIKRALQLSNPNNFRELVKKDCTLDLHLSILKYQEKSIELTRNEFRILYYFFMNEDKVISKEELLEKLWNDKYYLDENVLLVNMTRLKKKMKEIGIVHLLENIRGKGWKL